MPRVMIQIPRETLERWRARVERCEHGGFPTNVKLEIETFLAASYVICAACNGTGKDQTLLEDCTVCNGLGKY